MSRGLTICICCVYADLYSCIIISSARVERILRCDMKIAAGYPHVVTVSTCKWSHVKIWKVFCALRLHRTCIMSPVQTLCTVHAVHRPCSQTLLIRAKKRFLQHHSMWSIWCCHIHRLLTLKGPTSFCIDISLGAELCEKQKAWKAHDGTSTVASVRGAPFYVSPSIPRLSCNAVTGAE